VIAVHVKLGLGSRPAKADCAVSFTVKTPSVAAENIKITMFGDTPTLLKASYTLVAQPKTDETLKLELYVDAVPHAQAPAVGFVVIRSARAARASGRAPSRNRGSSGTRARACGAAR
jgi:hypothetical protein